MEKLIGWLIVAAGVEFRELGQSAQRWTDMVAIGGRYPLVASLNKGFVVARIPCIIKQQVSDDIIMGQLVPHTERDEAAKGEETYYYYEIRDYNVKDFKYNDAGDISIELI
jgi:hypothetical protein